MIYTDIATSTVTVVPDGYTDDIDSQNLPDQIDLIAAYEKNGFNDYEMISPAEILALMVSPDLIAKTLTNAAADYWTNDNDTQDGYIYQHSTGTIVLTGGQNTYLTIPVRRVVVT